MKTYIYAIKNLINNKMYIGSTKSLKSRKYEHFYQLKKGTHHSEHLQKSYNKYGKSNFAFYILLECSPEERKEKELYYIELNKTSNREFGYNVYEPNEDNFKCSEQTKEKLRNSDYCIAVDAYCIKELTKIGTYDSFQKCYRSIGINNKMISQILQGKRKSYKGVTFTLKDVPLNYTPSNKQRDMSKFRK